MHAVRLGLIISVWATFATAAWGLDCDRMSDAGQSRCEDGRLLSDPCDNTSRGGSPLVVQAYLAEVACWESTGNVCDHERLCESGQACRLPPGVPESSLEGECMFTRIPYPLQCTDISLEECREFAISTTPAFAVEVCGDERLVYREGCVPWQDGGVLCEMERACPDDAPVPAGTIPAVIHHLRATIELEHGAVEALR